MSIWNLQNIMSNVTASLGRRSDIGVSTLSFWTNEAQRQVWDQHPHSLQEAIAVSSSTSGENRITLPTDFQELLWLSNISFNPPVTMTPTTLAHAASYQSYLGQPVVYYQYADWLELYPKPDSAYSLQMRYRKRMTNMLALTDLPSVDTMWHYAVYLRAKELVASNVALDEVAAKTAASDYERFVARTPNDRARKVRENKFAAVSLPRGAYRTNINWPTSGDTWGR